MTYRDGRTETIALPQLTIAIPIGTPEAPEGRRVQVGGGTILLVLGAIALIGLAFGPTVAALVLGGIVALVVVGAAVMVPTVALSIMAVTEMANVSTVLIDYNGLPGIATPVLGLGAVSVLVAARSPAQRALLMRLPIAPMLLVGVYVVSVLPAVAATVSATASLDQLTELVRDAVFLLVALALARLSGRPWTLAAMIVIPMVVIAGMTVVNQFLLQETHSFLGFANISKASGELTTTPRHAGPMEDSNFWGRVLVLGLPLALALWHRAITLRRKLPGVGWTISILLLLGAVYLTQSRGTLLCAFVAVLVWIAASGPRVRRQALVLVPLLVAMLLLPGIGNRLLNVSEAFEDTPDYAKDPSIVERAAAGDIAREIFAEHPVVGTGPQTFAIELNEYAARDPGRLIGVTRATHNLYLEILSETGVIGLVGWIVLMGGVVLLGVRSILRLAGVPPSVPDPAPNRQLAAGALAAVLAWSLASLFLHMALPRTLWLVLALVGLVYVMTRDRAMTGERAARPAERQASAVAAAGLRAGIAVTLITAVAGATVGATILYTLGEDRFTAHATETLLPTAQVYESYALDVRSRRPVLPAYAAMLQGAQSRSALAVDAEPDTGLVSFTATGGTQQEAERRVAAALAAAPATLRGFGADRQYRLVDVSPVEVTAERVLPPTATLLAGLAVAAELAFCLLVLRLWPRRPAYPEGPTTTGRGAP